MAISRNIISGMRAAGRSMRHVASETGRVIVRGTRAAGRSYFRGVAAAYNGLNGNHAVQIQQRPTDYKSMGTAERWLHSSISFAWLWGFLGASIAHNVRSTLNTVSRASKFTWDLFKDFKTTLLHDPKRQWFPDALLGGLGFIVGAAISVVPVAVITTLFVGWNSLKSIWVGFRAACLLSLPLENHIENSFKRAFTTDSRHWFKKGVLGFPGLVIGVLLYSPLFVLVMAARVVHSSVQGFKLFAGNLILSALDKHYVFKDNMDYAVANRKYPRYGRYVLGFPGVALGVVTGALIAGPIWGYRGLKYVFANAFKTTGLVFLSMINTVLPRGMEVDVKPGLTSRSFVQKYIQGFPGLVIGGVAGFVGASVIVLGRVITNTAKTFREIAGGLMNLGLGRHVFAGFDAQSNFVMRFGFGLPGVLLAAPIAAIAACIFAVRHVHIPVAFVLAPFVALARAVHELGKLATGKTRFNAQNQTDPHLSQMKNLYAKLNGMGEFEDEANEQASPSAHSPTSATYTSGLGRNLLKFLRKSVTFNASSDSERFLHTLVKEYEEQLKSSIDSQINIENVVDSVKSKIIDDIMADCFTSAAEKNNDANQIDKIALHIKSYFQNNAIPVPADLYQDGGAPLFFRASDQEPVMGTVVPSTQPGMHS